MIHYQLRCDDGHAFEGWFRDSVAFEDQATRKLVSCPNCGSTGIERGLMAPSVRTLRRQSQPAEAAATETAPLPDQARAMLQRLRADIERHCDDVGDGFADAARRLHEQAPSGRGARRGIYGQASEMEREALADEGIEVARVPWLPRADG